MIQRFMRQPSWKKVQRIVVGGGFPESDVGERAILQAGAILEELGLHVQIARLSHDVDDGIDLTNVTEELIAQSFTLTSATHQAGDVGEIEVGGNNLYRL